MLLKGAIFVAAAALMSWLLASRVRLYALDKLVDIPNERSSHSSPTPRGGGLAIVITVLGGVVVAGIMRWIPLDLTLALAGGGTTIATVGWIDDHRDLAARIRFAVQVAAAVWAMYWLGGMPRLSVGVAGVELGFVGTILGLLGILWAINLYNFIDGIDGLAAGEAITTGTIAGLMLAAMGHPDLGLPSRSQRRCGPCIGLAACRGSASALRALSLVSWGRSSASSASCGRSTCTTSLTASTGLQPARPSRPERLPVSCSPRWATPI